MNKERGVTIEFSGSVTLDETELWPDGDAPRDWTAQDVKKLMGVGWLRDWNCDEDLTVTICADDGSRVETRNI
jgi:hypothetical protein